jgi:hypothetical protein
MTVICVPLLSLCLCLSTVVLTESQSEFGCVSVRVYGVCVGASSTARLLSNCASYMQQHCNKGLQDRFTMLMGVREQCRSVLIEFLLCALL